VVHTNAPTLSHPDDAAHFLCGWFGETIQGT
jgi:hypothetical protein